MNSRETPEPPSRPASLSGDALRDAITRMLIQKHGRMMRLARRLLAHHGVSHVDCGPEDVIQETLYALCHAAEDGGLRAIAGEDDLWRYFHTALDHQVLRARDHHAAIKRGGPGHSHAHAEDRGREDDRSGHDDGGEAWARARPLQRVDLDLDQRPSAAATPDEEAASREPVDLWLDSLSNCFIG
jgi:hypothetical protein